MICLKYMGVFVIILYQFESRLNFLFDMSFGFLDEEYDENLVVYFN